MSLDNPRGGLGYAAEFQSSALPFVTQSVALSYSVGPQRWDFPKVSRFIGVTNNGTAGQFLRIGFTRNGVTGSNYYLVDGGQQSNFEFRVTSLYVISDGIAAPRYSLAVGLTNIDAIEMPRLSGSLPDGTAGWIGVG